MKLFRIYHFHLCVDLILPSDPAWDYATIPHDQYFCSNFRKSIPVCSHQTALPAVARNIFLKHRCEHVTAVIKNHQWLPRYRRLIFTLPISICLESTAAVVPTSPSLHPFSAFYSLSWFQGPPVEYDVRAWPCAVTVLPLLSSKCLLILQNPAPGPIPTEIFPVWWVCERFLCLYILCSFCIGTVLIVKFCVFINKPEAHWGQGMHCFQFYNSCT